MVITIGSLCTGAGGLDLAVADVLGDARTAWVADPDPDAAKVLAARFGAPNLGDITTVDWRRVEPVDVLCAGFPCQDISNAGQRAGIHGPKSGVWRHVATAIGVLRPRLVLLENVAALLVRGGTRVVADLAALGYVGSWRTLRASDVGAPHRRERFFLAAADPDREPVRVQHEPVGARGSEGTKGGPNQRGSSGDLTLTSSVMLLPTPTASTGGAGDRDGGGTRLATLAAVDRWEQYGPAIRRWETILGRPAPEPTVTGKRGGRRLSAQFVEWLLGWPEGWVTDLVSNTAALRLCGNGVVRQQGAVAYQALLEVIAGA